MDSLNVSDLENLREPPGHERVRVFEILNFTKERGISAENNVRWHELFSFTEPDQGEVENCL